MLSKDMQQAINDQINFELYSSYIYLAMAAWFEDQNMGGAANWMKVQTREETDHAMKLFDYVNERDGRVALETIKAPPFEWESTLEVFEHAYKHEKTVTARICNLVDLAVSEKDYVTNSTLQWFINEQIEEESNVKTIIDKIKMASGSPDMLYMIDNELAQRAYVPLASAEA